MSEDKGKDPELIPDEKTMARLIELAGPRSDIPEGVESRVYSRVHGTWKQSPAQPRAERVYSKVRREWKESKRYATTRRWVAPIALAASVVVAVSLWIQPQPPGTIAVPVGTVARSTGGTDSAPLPPSGSEFFVGNRLVTGPNQGMSVQLANAESLRLDAGTVLEIEAAGRFRLLGGRIYADTGDLVYRARSLVIDTPLGVVTDVGTQFMLTVSGEGLDVAVREGRVDVGENTETHTAVAGELLQITQAGDPVYQQVSATDPSWDWATALAPEFDINNKSLLDILRWAARETGRELVFEDPELRMAAMRTELHGSVSGIEPLDALRSVLTTTSFRYRIEGTRIVIER